MSALVIAHGYIEASVAADQLGLEDWYTPHERDGDVHAHVPGVETIVYVEGWEAGTHPAEQVAIAIEAARQHGADLELEYEWPGNAHRARTAARVLAAARNRYWVARVPPEAANTPTGRTRPRAWWRRLLGLS